MAEGAPGDLMERDDEGRVGGRCKVEDKGSIIIVGKDRLPTRVLQTEDR